MKIEIKKPLDLLLEFTFLNGVLADKAGKIPELDTINEFINELKEMIEVKKNENVGKF